MYYARNLKRHSDSAMNDFSLLFLVVLAAMLLTETWLGRRQIAHVMRHRGEVPDAFSERIDLATHQKAADYTVARTSFSLWAGLYGAAILLLLTLGGGLQWLDDRVRGLADQPLLIGTLFILTVSLVNGLLELPVGIIKTFRLEQRFGFNKTTPRLFVVDRIKQVTLFLLIGTPLIVTALWLMQISGEYWWFYLWCTWVAFNLVAIWAYPTLIAPLFNRFEPLDNATVREAVTGLLERTGFRSRGLFKVDGSRRSAHSNAYFTGLGRSKRVVFFDTLLEKLDADEIVAVLAHELGHFRHRHIVKRIALFFVMSLVALALLGWLARQDWFYAGLGMTTPSNHAALVLFLFAGPVFWFFIQPLMSRLSRRHEFEADAFATTHARADDLVTALLKLYRENASTLTPDPVYSAFYDSHPPAPVRIQHLQTHS